MVWNFSLWSKIQCNWKYRGIVDSVILIFPYLSWLCLCIKQRARSFSSSIHHLKGFGKRHQKCSVSPHFPPNTNIQLSKYSLVGKFVTYFKKWPKGYELDTVITLFHCFTPFNTDEWDRVEWRTVIMWMWWCDDVMRSVSYW